MNNTKYNMQELPPAIVNKSLKAKQAFLSGYSSAISRGLTDDEAYFSGLSQATTAERLEKASRQPSEPIKPKLPQHLAVLLEKRSEAATAPPVSTPRIKQEFLGKNALVPDSDRSLVSATWDRNGRLQLQFDDGQKIITDPVPVSENIEQYISVTAGSSEGGSGGTSATTLNELTDVTAVSPQDGQFLVYDSSSGTWQNKTITNTATEGDNDVLAKRTDVIDDFTLYQAEAAAGVSSTSAGWRIRLITFSVDGDTTVTWAGGNASYDKVWDDRLTYAYS